jgi:cobalt-zinc-cadmium efflux system outer membrane protein
VRRDVTGDATCLAKKEKTVQLCRTILLIGLLGVSMIAAHEVAQVAAATGNVTVDDLVARALADNPDLQAIQAEVDAANGRLQQAGLRPNPLLELGVQQNVTGPDNNVTAGLTVPLDLNGRKAGRVGVAAGELEIKRAQVAERARLLRAEVRMKAGELLAVQRNLRFTEELLQVNREALDLLHTRVNRGAAPPLEEKMLRVEVNRLEAGRHLLHSQVEVRALQVKTLVGLEPEAVLSLRGELRPAPVQGDLQRGLAKALATRSDLLVAHADVGMAEAMIHKEQAEGRFDANVNVGYMRQDTGFDLRGITASGGTRPIQDVFHYVGAGVSITLPVRNRNQGNIAAAMATATAAKRRQAAVMLTIRQEVTAAFTQYDAAQRALALYTQGVREPARQNLEVVRQTYTLGRATLMDVIAEQRRYIDIETGYTEALKQAYDAVVDIERAVGTLEP